MNLRYLRRDAEVGQATILRYDGDGAWTVETLSESGDGAKARQVPNSVAARLIEFEEYGFALARKAKRRTVRGE